MEKYISARDNRVAAWESFASSYKRVTEALENEWKRIEDGHTDVAAKKEGVAREYGSSDISDDDILDINAGGEIVRVTRGTLTQFKGTPLEAIFSGRWEKRLQRDSKGCIFLDVNPTCFRGIVDYLNECKIADPDEGHPDSLTVDRENQAFLDHLSTAFGLSLSLGGFSDSLILIDKKHAHALKDFLLEDDIKGSATLLYRGTRDGMDTESFHRICDNKGPTVTVVATTEGYIVGGYADKSWASTGGWAASDKAFLFSLHCYSGNDPVKMAISRDSSIHALYHDSGWGPTFGGNDLHVIAFGSAWGKLLVYSSLEGTYVIPPHWDEDSLIGEDNHAVSEIEVFSIQDAPMSTTKPRSKSRHQKKTLEELDFDDFPDVIRVSFQEERAALAAAAAGLAELQDAFDNEQTAVQVLCGGDANEIVHMNVSGRTMAVKHSTLRNFPNSVFFKQFADPNWKPPGASKVDSPREWTATHVMEWTKTIQGLCADISSHFRDVTGAELLALEREDINNLGILRPGTVALVVKAIQELRNEQEASSAAFIEHSAYCVGKIIDHMRLKSLEALNVPAPAAPEIREPDRKRFKRIVEYYFPTEEAAAQFLG